MSHAKIAFAIMTCALVWSAPVSAQSDSIRVDSLRRAAVERALEYERSLRSDVPFRLQQNQFCDERLGRYCIIYDRTTSGEIPPEPPKVVQSRAAAIEAFAAAFRELPGDTAIAAPLVRYMIEQDSADAAIPIAQLFADKTTAPGWGDLLVAFALHAAKRDVESESVFARALVRMLPPDRAAMHNILPLLTNEEREKYQLLRGPDRGVYLQRLWNLADPLYLTDGNESVAEHFSRRVYARILAMAPDEPQFAWGTDREMLTIRYGVPLVRSRSFGQTGGAVLSELHHPHQLTYVPPALITKGGAREYEPGAPWPYDTVRERSGYAPSTFYRMHVLKHQASRFGAAANAQVRVDYVTPEELKNGSIEIGLFVLDSLFNVVAQERDTVDAADAGSITAALPPLSAGYSLEMRNLSSGSAARARHAFPARSGRIVLSDLVITVVGAEPPMRRDAPDFKPHATLDITKGEVVGLYVEAQGLARGAGNQSRYRVDLEVLEQERPGVFSRIVRNLGRAFGRDGQDVAPRITWTQQSTATTTVPISLKLGALQLDQGLKKFRVTVTDLENRSVATIERLIRVQ